MIQIKEFTNGERISLDFRITNGKLASPMANVHPLRTWLSNQRQADGKPQTQKWLARRLRISNTYLSMVLSSDKPITDRLAKDIKRVTGLELVAASEAIAS